LNNASTYSIIYFCEGCTDPEANNYNPYAMFSDGSCEYEVPNVDISVDTMTTILGGCDVEPTYFIPQIVLNNVGDEVVDVLCINFEIEGLQNDTICFNNIDFQPGETQTFELPQTYNEGEVNISVLFVNGNYDTPYGDDVFDIDNDASYIYDMWCLDCIDPEADNYNPYADINQTPNNCEYWGCMDIDADNYDPDANVDDGSCEYLGCTDSTADNYDPNANVDDGSCDYLGCTDPNALNYDPQATIDDGSCNYDIFGCTDPNADNYDPDATIDNNSCIYFGCTDPEAFNYDPTANTDDNSCMYYGCTDSDADNYDPNADINDGSCQYLGCTDSEALNYDPDANVDDGNCVYPPSIDPCDDADIYVPNTFTPDNDGLNDVWFVSTTPDCWRSFDIRVYDRWGQLVWQTEDVNDVWLGGFTGGTHFIADGIYIYQIIAHKWNTEVHQSSGFVTIIR